MKRFHLLILAGIAMTAPLASLRSQVSIDIIDDFSRGDANGDLAVDASDGSYITNYLFQGGPQPPCMDAADANDDGDVTSADATYIFEWVYNGGPTPPSPGPFSCGEDPTADSLDCQEATCP